MKRTMCGDRRDGERGSALLVAVILVLVVSLYIVSNCVTLGRVRNYLGWLETRQKVRLEEGTHASADVPPAASSDEIR